MKISGILTAHVVLCAEAVTIIPPSKAWDPNQPYELTLRFLPSNECVTLRCGDNVDLKLNFDLAAPLAGVSVDTLN